jgi:DNA-binding transcriptional MerR regulator
MWILRSRAGKGDDPFKGRNEQWAEEKPVYYGPAFSSREIMLDSVADSRVYNMITPQRRGVKFMNALAEKQSIKSSRLLKVGDVSKQTGLGIETLRFYEKAGILDRPARTDSGYRLYDPGVLERIAFIKQAQVLGFTLEEIRQLIDHKKAGENPCREVREIVRHRLDELDEKLRQMRKYRNELSKALKEWDALGERKGHVCGLIENTRIESATRDKAKIGFGRRRS